MKIAKITVLVHSVNYMADRDATPTSDFITTMDNEEYLDITMISSEEKYDDRDKYGDDDYPLNFVMTKEEAEKYFDGIVDEKIQLDEEIKIAENYLKGLKKQRGKYETT